MIGIYFSGTGNSKYCLEVFLNICEKSAVAYAIEETGWQKRIQEHEEIIFSYPVQYSNIPKILYDFVVAYKDCWRGKKIYVIATMGLFSGDGAGVLARLLNQYGAQTYGGLHVKMPDSISDEKLLKHSYQKNQERIEQAKEKVEKAALLYMQGKPSKDGIGIIPHLGGLFGQRLYFYKKTKQYSNGLKIDTDACIGCGLCAQLCPMNNLVLSNEKVIIHTKCTMCYRCISQCPKQAITLLGSKVVNQYHIKNYIK